MMAGRKSGTITEEEKAASSRRMHEKRQGEKQNNRALPVSDRDMGLRKIIRLLTDFSSRQIELDHRFPSLRDPQRYEWMETNRRNTIKRLKQIIEDYL
jgi:hypothetical protein